LHKSDPAMRVFIETASLEEVEQARELGVLDGIVTRPAMFAREKVDPLVRLQEIRKLTPAPIFVDIRSVDRRSMIHDAKQRISAMDQVIVKLPAIKEGLKACKQLSKDGCDVCMTLIYQVSQAMFAGKAGARWISPYVPAFEEGAQDDGMWLVTRIRQLFTQYHYETKIMVAGVRTPQHLLDAASVGVDAVVVPLHVIDALVADPLTDAALKQLLREWGV
jgi:transaldolase